MYVNPFVCGMIFTVLLELALVIAYALIKK